MNHIYGSNNNNGGNSGGIVSIVFFAVFIVVMVVVSKPHWDRGEFWVDKVGWVKKADPNPPTPYVIVVTPPPCGKVEE